MLTILEKPSNYLPLQKSVFDVEVSFDDEDNLWLADIEGEGVMTSGKTKPEMIARLRLIAPEIIELNHGFMPKITLNINWHNDINTQEIIHV